MSDRLRAIEAGATDAREALSGPTLRTFEEVTASAPGFPTGSSCGRLLSSGAAADRAALTSSRLVGVSRRLVARGVREGSFRRVDPMVFHFGLVGALVFFFATEPTRRRARHALAPRGAAGPKDFVRYLEEPDPPRPRRRRRRRHQSRKGARS